ncbi:MAG: galactose oxidase-like domain-containing protein [Burkholderiales bacterium]
MHQLSIKPRQCFALTAAVLVFLQAWPLTAQAQSSTFKNQEKQAAHSHEKSAKACQPADIEAKKHLHEKDQLGPSHADQHARMRRFQCEVESGVRKRHDAGRVVAASQTLKDDAAAKEAVIKSKTNSPDLRGLGGGSAIGTPGIAPSGAALAAGDPATMGRWSDPFIIPVVGVTAVLLHTGNVMFWSYDPVNYFLPDVPQNGVGFIWNPKTRSGYNIPPPENIWCSAQTILADGRVYVAGGNLGYPNPNAPAGMSGWKGSLTNYTFNPLAERWAKQPDMQRGRWYPTATQLADNRVVITSGIDETGSNAITNVVEMLTPDPNIDGIGQLRAVSIHNSSGLYPLQFLLPSGQMLEAGPGAASSFQFNPATSNWSGLPRMNHNHYYLGNGVSYTDVSVVPSKQLIMVAGGHTERAPQADNEWLDGFNPARGWSPYPQWRTPRHNANTVILPDGSLFTVGGNRGLYGYEDPIFEPELYAKAASDLTGSWLPMASHAIQAAYHSTAILLPDATVLLSQDDMDYSAQAAFQHKAQVYSPPYLFKGAQPQITAAPERLAYGLTFSIATDRGDMVSAVLVAPGATTHGNDMHQRVIKLRVQPQALGLTASVPASSALVPPGYYMLFVLDAAGIPSVAKFVQIS